MKAILKWLLNTGLLLVLITGATPLAASASTGYFSDIQGHWAKQQVEIVYSVGLVKGYPDGLYKPNQPVTYLEAITIILNGAGYSGEIAKIKKPKNSPPSPYPVPWGQNYLDFAVNQKFIPPKVLNNFVHDRPITRAEFAALIASTLYLTGSGNPPLFADGNSIDHDYISAVDAMHQQGIMKGYPDGTFKPKAPVSRAEVAAMLGSLYDQGWIHLDPKRKISGWVSKVSQQKNGIELEVNSIYGTVKVLADANCLGYWQGQPLDLQQIINYRVEGILNSSRKVAYLELLERRNFSPVQSDVYASYLRLAEGEPVIITVKNLLSNEVDYSVDWDAEVFDEKSQGKSTKNKDLLKKVKPGQFLKIGVTSDDTIKSITILNVKTITGEVASLNRTLKLKTSSSSNKTKYEPDEFWAWDWGRIIDKEGKDISNIKVGDKVKITYIGAPFEERVLEIQIQ